MSYESYETRLTEILATGNNEPMLSGEQRVLAPLAAHLRDSIHAKYDRLVAEGHNPEILTPDWCRENPTEAGELHAEIIVKTYGSTYALPNKDPIANKAAIEEGNLDIYLLKTNGSVVGTACLVNMGDGRAELGRSASLGSVGNSIIQDLRILDWLVNPEAAAKYHTLFTTLRSAPDRQIDEDDGRVFTMRGGQGVTAHWKKFPGLIVSGFGPLYLKHGSLEQFSCASITRQELARDVNVFIADEDDVTFVESWHDNYQIPRPKLIEGSGEAAIRFDAHYPPKESGLTNLVHADIVSNDSGVLLADALSQVEEAGSPFMQVVIPIDRDTRSLQNELKSQGYQVFGYQPAFTEQSPVLLFGKVKPGIEVVPTFWEDGSEANPFWQNEQLLQDSKRIASKWKID